MRYFIDLSYNGTNYHGWQVQKNAVSVQQVLNETLSTILRTKIETVGSGRTDAGVHALQQYVHLDSDIILDTEPYLFRFNSLLPKDISIKSIRKVNGDSHARFSASLRSYEYRIGSKKNPFAHDLEYAFRHKLDVDAMNKASGLLLNTLDFESFSRVNTDVNNFLCTVSRAEWQQHNETLTFYVSANRFLRGMVRALVGTFLDVGLAKITIEKFEDIIKSRDRKMAGDSAPARGLFLTEVLYPKETFID